MKQRKTEQTRIACFAKDCSIEFVATLKQFYLSTLEKNVFEMVINRSVNMCGMPDHYDQMGCYSLFYYMHARVSFVICKQIKCLCSMNAVATSYETIKTYRLLSRDGEKTSSTSTTNCINLMQMCVSNHNMTIRNVFQK